MIRRLGAELLSPAGAHLGEGPSWDSRRGVWCWVDITSQAVYLTDESGVAVSRWSTPQDVGAALPSAAGFLLASRDGFDLLAEDGTITPVCAVQPDRPDIRFNDAKCDPRGRAFAGTMAYAETPGEAMLVRLDPGPVACPVLTGLTLANGLGWSPDGHHMYFIDSRTQRVGRFEYDPDAGELGARVGEVEIPAPQGMPDGMCVDDTGAIWVALWGGSAVHRYTPDGALDTVIALPTRHVTSVAFGGAGGSTLLITTARFGLDDATLAAEPYAGGLFVVEPGVTGPPATPWSPLPSERRKP